MTDPNHVGFKLGPSCDRLVLLKDKHNRHLFLPEQILGMLIPLCEDSHVMKHKAETPLFGTIC